MEERIHEIRTVNLIQSVEETDEGDLKHLDDNIKWTNICITGVPKGEDRKGQKAYSKK